MTSTIRLIAFAIWAGIIAALAFTTLDGRQLAACLIIGVASALAFTNARHLAAAIRRL
jgi:hypothetical protein